MAILQEAELLFMVSLGGMIAAMGQMVYLGYTKKHLFTKICLRVT
jgi:hypothetical protein